MKERPILFSSAMVRAILDGSKTQTRRVVKPQFSEPPTAFTNPVSGVHVWGVPITITMGSGTVVKNGVESELVINKVCEQATCPYGQVGDRLWVRETWRTVCDPDDMKISQMLPSQETLWYRADEPWNTDAIWRPSIFMPRWASRLTLEITDVRVQRLQEITGEDAGAEGVNCAQWDESDWIDSDGYPTNYHERQECAVEEVSELWDSINAKSHPWESNPWVWAISFEVVN